MLLLAYERVYSSILALVPIKTHLAPNFYSNILTTIHTYQADSEHLDNPFYDALTILMPVYPRNSEANFSCMNDIKVVLWPWRQECHVTDAHSVDGRPVRMTAKFATEEFAAIECAHDNMRVV